MNTRVLFLAPDDAGAALLLELDAGGRVLSRTELAPGATVPAAGTGGRTVVVVPGGPVRIDRLHLPAHSNAQALAAARALVAERLARPDGLHVALARDEGTPRWVAAVDSVVMRTWLARVEAFGLRADAVVPEALLLPEPPGPGVVHVVEAAGHWIARGDGLAFSAPADLARRVLGERQCVHIEDGLDGLGASALHPPLDLLQGDFAVHATPTGPSWRRVAWLAAALAVSPLLLVAGQAVRLELAARSLEARADAALAAALSDAHGAATPTESLQVLRAPRQFAAATGALFAAVSARPGTHLVALEYSAGDRVRAVLFHRDAADVEALRGALVAHGWHLAEGGSTDVAGGLHTGLVLESSR